MENCKITSKPCNNPSCCCENCKYYYNERVVFIINKEAFGQHLGLVNWNNPDRWYKGEK